MAANRIRVPIKGSVGKSILLPTGGNGATIGLDLKLPNGTVPTLAQLAAALGVSSTASSTTQGTYSANPTATVSGTAVNGVATTFMRSDAAPALADTAVTPGTYGLADVTVDAQGRLTAASSGIPQVMARVSLRF